MKLRAMAKTVAQSKPVLMLKVMRLLNELYRAAFVSTAVAEGIATLLREGPKSGAELHDELGLSGCQRELEIWLDLGVSLGELGKDERGYRLKGRLSRKLADPENDTLHGFLQARVEVLYDYIVKTPAALREGRRFVFDDAYGEVFARSSRTVEPLLVDIVERLVPAGDGRRLLEVGCGSGIYVRKACSCNETLQVVGLELSHKAAEHARNNVAQWGLSERVRIESIDVREFSDNHGFDMVTLYNLIYYFSEAERIELLRHLHSLLKPGGLLVLTSLTASRDPSTMMMDLWASMTEGQGPLPKAAELVALVQEAGFDSVEHERVLFPNFLLCQARKAADPS